MPKTITPQEVLAKIPEAQALSVPESFFQEVPTEETAWHKLYRWLVEEHGQKDEAPGLYGRVLASQKLMARLKSLERKRLSKKGLRGERLSNALAWSDLDSGPREIFDDKRLEGEGLVLLPQRS